MRMLRPMKGSPVDCTSLDDETGGGLVRPYHSVVDWDRVAKVHPSPREVQCTVLEKDREVFEKLGARPLPSRGKLLRDVSLSQDVYSELPSLGVYVNLIFPEDRQIISPSRIQRVFTSICRRGLGDDPRNQGEIHPTLTHAAVLIHMLTVGVPLCNCVPY